MDIIHALQDTAERTNACFDLQQDDLARSYGPGKWTVRQILVHLADTESVLHERIKRVIAGPPQVIWAFDQDLWCNALEYETFPLALSRALYQANRQSIMYLAGTCYVSQGHKTFVHSETGLRTLKDEFDKVAAHNNNHLQQIATALAMR